MRDRVQDFRSHPDLAALPEAPDLADHRDARRTGPAAVDACAVRGVKVTIVMSSGYGETADPQAIVAEKAMVERAGILVCALVWYPLPGTRELRHGQLSLSFSTIVRRMDSRWA